MEKCSSFPMQPYLLTCFLLLIICPLFRSQTTTNEPQLPLDEVNALNSIATNLGVVRSYWPSSCSSQTEALSPTILCRCESVCHVTQLIFNSRDLYGVIPQALADLTHLEKLDLSGNQLHGPMPPFLGNLTQLIIMDLSRNNLGGFIPEFLSQMRHLRYLSLAENGFEGHIPRFLGQMPSLNNLLLSFNLLKGPIPPELGNISTLEVFSFAANMIDGEIPESLGNWTELREFWASENGLSGRLPISFQNLKSLRNFGIRGNNISGQIPQFIKNWKQLIYLSLIGNNFKGPLPSGISSLEQLTSLFISDIRSEVNYPFPNLSGLKALTSLVLRNCKINGTIPRNVAENLRSLTYLDLSFNSLTGEIPDSFQLLKLNTMYLTGNMLNGTIPAWITNSASSLDLSFNNFSSVNLRHLNKKANMNLFDCCTAATANVNSTQRIMDTYCPKAKPKYDTLYINCGGERTTIEGRDYEEDLYPFGALTSYVSPSGKWAYSSTGDYTLSSAAAPKYIQNLTCGLSVPDAPLYATTRLSPISLKYFGFCLHNGNYEVKLHFAEIVFTDDKYLNSTVKRVFDIFVQGEKLEGFSISEPKKPIVKNFSVVVKHHVLEIHLYWAGKGSINIQPRLYGPLLSAISVTRAIQSSRKVPHKIIIVVTIVSLIFIVLVLALFREKGWLGRRSICKDGIELQGNCFSLQQIKTATQNFSPDSKISEGGFGAVYKGQLPITGMEIAVKQLSSKSEQRIHKFAIEVGTMASFQHPNLMRLLGYCNEANQLLVIYEFKGDYSLARVLYGSEASRKSLDWPTRYKICLGIAKGLACLHNEYNIIHSDIKATNILLDRDFNAKISEFGLAKLYEGDDKPIVNKTAGIHGYMAPEYAVQGILTDKVDVYSFGVLTLEIVSGKSNAGRGPNQESVYLLDEAYVLQQDNNLVTLIDRALQFNYVVGEATRILDLAMSCLNHSPTLRPKMSDVVTILEGKMPMKVPSRSYSGILSTCILQTSTSRDGGRQISEETQNMI